MRIWLPALVLAASLSAFSQTSVLTQHNDLSRTGQNLTETLLTPASVSAGNFGKLFTLSVDGMVLAQPLYVAKLSLAGAKHNVVFVATMHDSVYAFDADAGGNPLWHASLLDAAHGAAVGATPDPEMDTGCYIANGEFGIMGTPVIDSSSNTIYVVSLTYENNYPVQRLHALDITSGSEKLGGPVVIAASQPGTGTGSSNGVLNFDPKWESNRAGLALVNGTVYVAFAAHCDLGNFHGWLMAYNAGTLAQTAVLLTSPNGEASGIWMGAAAPSFDTANSATRMFLTTGNGSYDGSTDYADDILRLDISNGLHIDDAFTPFNQAFLQTSDSDLGSSGALILPDQSGPYPHLLIEASKGGAIYLVNRDNLGGYSTIANNVVQEIDNQASSAYGLPAYWNGYVYLWPTADHLKQFTLAGGTMSPSPVSISPQIQSAGLGSTPSISANGTTNGIVWSIDSSQSPQVLYAHDASNVANLLWASSANASRDNAGPAAKFVVPTVANGKVYVGAISEVSVYGLPDFLLNAANSSVTVTQGQTASSSIIITDQGGYSSAVSLNASNLPPGVTAAFTAAANSSDVTFTADTNATPGTYSVAVNGTSGALIHSLNVNLVVAGFTVTSSPSTLTLAASNTATSQITIASTQFTGTVSFTCSVASTLANVACSIPGSVTGGAGTVPIAITAGATARVPPHHLPQSPILPCVVLSLVVSSFYHALTRKNKFKVFFCASAFGSIVMLASCRGGSSTNITTTASSLAESGLVTVVGTSGSLSHTTTISVTIQ